MQCERVSKYNMRQRYLLFQQNDRLWLMEWTMANETCRQCTYIAKGFGDVVHLCYGAASP